MRDIILIKKRSGMLPQQTLAFLDIFRRATHAPFARLASFPVYFIGLFYYDL